MRKTPIFVFLFLSLALSQSNVDILMKIKEKYNKLEDFQAKVKIQTTIPNFRMPVKTIQLFYKTPDKLKVKTKGFALIPKKGIMPFMYLDKVTHDSIQVDTCYSRTINNKILTFISISDTSVSKTGTLALILDNILERIEKVNVIVGQDTISTINFEYQNIDGFWMPNMTDFSFNMPKRISDASGPSMTNPFGKIDRGSAAGNFQNKGNVKLFFTKIKVNQGLEDSFFRKDEK